MNWAWHLDVTVLNGVNGLNDWFWTRAHLNGEFDDPTRVLVLSMILAGVSFPANTIEIQFKFQNFRSCTKNVSCSWSKKANFCDDLLVNRTRRFQHKNRRSLNNKKAVNEIRCSLRVLLTRNVSLSRCWMSNVFVYRSFCKIQWTLALYEPKTYFPTHTITFSAFLPSFASQFIATCH